MRHVPRALLAGGLGFAAAAIVACGGGSGLLSSNQASDLNNQLDQLSSAIQAGQCANARSAASSFAGSVDGLQGVNPRLVSNLKDWATTVGNLTARDCKPVAATTTPTTTTATTATTTSTSTSTRTTAPATTSTPTQPTQPATTSTPSGSTTQTPSTGGASPSDGNGGSGGAGAGSNGNGQ